MSREQEIIDALIDLSDIRKRTVPRNAVRDWVRANTSEPIKENWDGVVRQVLRTLSGMGMVEPGEYQDIVLTDAFFDSTPTRKAYLKRNNQGNQQLQGGDGRRNRPPGDNGPDEPGDVGGEGFREVLSHPYLFAVSEKDFEQLLDAI